MKIAIIGAGPSGLVTAKTLVEARTRFGADIQVSVFEGEDKIGGTFRYRSYDSATLVSSKQLTCFSDFRMPLGSPDHPTLESYVQYLEDYVSHFKLDKEVDFKLSTKVIKIERGGEKEGGHWVTSQRNSSELERSEHFTHLSICSGLHVTPAVFEIPGLPSPLTTKEEVNERAAAIEEEKKSRTSTSSPSILSLHSCAYSSPSIFKDKSVLILGTGETGMDLSFFSVKGLAKQITLSTRSGFLSFPAVLSDFRVFGVDFDGSLPIDGLITNLFETAYVHPWVAKSHLRWFVSDAVIKKVLWFLTGTEAGCNQWVGELPEEKLGRAYVFLNKSAKAMPYINKKWKNRSKLAEKLATYLDPPSFSNDEPSVDLAPFPSHFTKDGQVIFKQNGRKEDFAMRDQVVRPDVVVYATGYCQNFDFLDCSYPTPEKASCRDIISPEDPSVSFIGFVRPGVGAIPPQSELAAQLWTLIILGKVPIPTSLPHYYLLSKPDSRVTYGVDYSSYTSQLARDMGAAPHLTDLLQNQGVFITLIYCFGAAFPTLYRLEGPWKYEGAPAIVKTEIWETIKRRGIIGNITMGLIPMLFYAYINLAAYVLEKTLRGLQFMSRTLMGKRSMKKSFKSM